MVKHKSRMLIPLFVILFALTLRFYIMISYGITHEAAIDSFFYHSEANVLIKYHRFTWWLDLLSLWGLYPYSDSPAAPTYVAEISMMSGISVESSILIFDILIVILGVLSIYILTLKIRRSTLYAFSSSFVFSIAPIIVPWTMWSLGEREFLVYYTPFFASLFIYILNKKHIKSMIFIICLSGFVLTTIHLMFIFLYGIPLALILLMLKDKFSLFKNISFKMSLNRWLKGFTYLGIFTLFFYSLFILNIFLRLPYTFSINNYTQTAILTGTSPQIIFLNIWISISGGVGVLVPVFLPIGLLYIMFNKRNNKTEKYLFWAFTLSIPIIINRLYSRPIIVFFSSILVGYGVLVFYKHIKGNRIKILPLIKVAIIVILFISTTIFTVWYVYHIESRSRFVIEYAPFATHSTYEIGVYQKNRLDKIWVTNDWLTGQRIQAYSGIPEQPGMVGSPLIYNPVYFCLVNRSVLKIHSSEITYLYAGRWYTSDYYTKQSRDYYSLFFHSYDSTESKSIISTYKIKYVIEYSSAKDKLVGYHSKHIRDSIFLKDIDKSTYIVYQNNNYRCYIIMYQY